MPLELRLTSLAVAIGERLRKRGEKVGVGESSAGGLISVALLAVPGASDFYSGGAVAYTRESIENLVGIEIAQMRARRIRSSSEPYAQWLAMQIRERLNADWGLAETGAAGPTGNGYGDPAGHTCLAVDGPRQAVETLRTGSDDRAENMIAFAEAAMRLFLKELDALG